MKLHNLLLIMVVIFAVFQLGMDQFPKLVILFNVIGVGALIPLFFRQALSKPGKIHVVVVRVLVILAVVAFTFIRDW